MLRVREMMPPLIKGDRGDFSRSHPERVRYTLSRRGEGEILFVIGELAAGGGMGEAIPPP